MQYIFTVGSIIKLATIIKLAKINLKKIYSSGIDNTFATLCNNKNSSKEAVKKIPKKIA